MILASGARGPGFKSRTSPLAFSTSARLFLHFFRLLLFFINHFIPGHLLQPTWYLTSRSPASSCTQCFVQFQPERAHAQAGQIDSLTVWCSQKLPQLSEVCRFYANSSLAVIMAIVLLCTNHPGISRTANLKVAHQRRPRWDLNPQSPAPEADALSIRPLGLVRRAWPLICSMASRSL